MREPANCSILKAQKQFRIDSHDVRQSIAQSVAFCAVPLVFEWRLVGPWRGVEHVAIPGG